MISWVTANNSDMPENIMYDFILEYFEKILIWYIFKMIRFTFLSFLFFTNIIFSFDNSNINLSNINFVKDIAPYFEQSVAAYKIDKETLDSIVKRFYIVYDLLKDDKTNNDLIIEYVDGLKLLSYNYFEYEVYHNDIYYIEKDGYKYIQKINNGYYNIYNFYYLAFDLNHDYANKYLTSSLFYSTLDGDIRKIFGPMSYTLSLLKKELVQKKWLKIDLIGNKKNIWS